MTSNYGRPTPTPLNLDTSTTLRPLPFAPLSPPLPPPPVSPSTYFSSDRPRPTLTPHESSGTIVPLQQRSESVLSGRDREGSLPSPPVSGGSAEGADGERIRSGRAEKKANPLEDLIRTETLYVDDLGAIIKRVAGAWSRANFPPPALDSMFRAVEAVYRINKSLLGKLVEIGPSPSSPKALGDLLMRWITDIEPAYARYATTFLTSFDSFDPVQSNPRLHEILATLSWPGTLPLPLPPLPADVDFPLPPRAPTLDDCFQLPIVRLKYYKKLYSKLLKSTQEGRSDHALLVGANERLDALLVKCELAMERSVVEEHAVGEERESSARKSDGSGKGVSLSSGSDRFSSQTGTSAATSGTLLSGPPRIEDLERRLCTDRALDIFTMLPKKCKLQMAPPSLPFVRTLRRSADVVLSFTPRSDPAQREVVVRRAYIFLLTDLFLICERMSSDDRAQMGGPNGDGPDMWLLYPPLAGKHLRVREGVEDEVEVTVMGKEKLVIRTEGRDAALEWWRTFEDVIAFGVSQGPASRSDSAASRRTDLNPPRSDSEASNSPPFLPPINTSGTALRNVPFSPLSADSRPRASPDILSPRFDHPPADLGIGYGRPPRVQSFEQRQQEQQWDRPQEQQWDRPQEQPPSREQWDRQRDGQRRAASAGPSVPPPPRKQSMYAGQGHQSLSAKTAAPAFAQLNDDFGRFTPSPSSANFPPSAYAPQNGNYPPLQGGHYPPPPPPPNPNYAYANGGHSQQPSPINANFPSRSQSSSSQYTYPTPHFSAPHSEPHHESDSSRSNGSNGSASGRTDRSSAYPPPPGAQNPHRASEGLLMPSGSIHRSRSADGLSDNQYRAPSVAMGDDRSASAPGSTCGDGGRYGRSDESPPPSPLDKPPEVTAVVAQMRCKAFLQQNHAQWKSLGTARLKLFVSTPSGTKQLVVDSDKSDKKTFVSTIVLTDGVERVGKTGVAIELSNRGSRTGIIYMLQMKTEQSAVGLFEQLLMGSDRALPPRR